ncbi:antibiotic biosynthesis monooxygenase family protein [Cyclobacterium xiamenense]|uniref:antibiotic biosynthesis monooxygenase family protein n=1 Tax=Cyclobacterium xiamenense TaxID=1297121 RepID=UPI001F51160F|nr:antibiotic biosynthesis monooxygenase [Cyclobacterium xiamenense]
MQPRLPDMPTVPYYAVIFTSIKQPEAGQDYVDMAREMEDLVRNQPGYLGHESARDSLGITVSYWDSLEAIAAWKKEARHRMAQQLGREKWYQHYTIRICKVEKEYSF